MNRQASSSENNIDSSPSPSRSWGEWPHWILLALIWVVAAVGLALAPDRVPTHWNLQGQPDKWGSKWFGLLLTPAIAVGLYLLLKFLPKLDPARSNYAKFARTYDGIRLTLLLMMAVVQTIIVVASIGVDMNVGLLMLVGMGALFIVIGWLIGNVEPNWFVGVRTPWTLTSELSWHKTHHAARWVFIFGGIVIAAAGATQEPWLFIAALVAFFAGVIGLVVYSYLVWKKDPERIQAPPVRPS